MGVAVVLVVLVVVGLIVIAALALPLALASLRKDEKARDAAAADAPALLDATFDGRPDVVFKVTARTLPYEAVVLGAKDRGYRLLSQADDQATRTQTLVFTKGQA